MNFALLLLFVCIFFFFMAPSITWIYFEFRHMRLSALIEQIFGVHGVQEMFLRLSFSYFNKFSFMDCSVDLSTLSHIKTACSVQVK